MTSDVRYIFFEQDVLAAIQVISAAAAAQTDQRVRMQLSAAVAALVRIAAPLIAAQSLRDEESIAAWCDRALSCISLMSEPRMRLEVQASVLAIRATVRLEKKKTLVVARPSTVQPKKEIAFVSKKSDTISANQKKIREFVRGHPDIRTKELLTHFASSISPRTLKRYLKDMVAAQMLERIERMGAVAYRSIEEVH